MFFKSAERPLCRWCAKPIRKHTITVYVKTKPSEYDRPNVGFSRYAYTDKMPATKQECQRREPEKYGKLKDDMDRTGNANGPFQRLQIMQATKSLRDAPPPLPMMGPYLAMVIDFPWPGEIDADQESIDKRGRAMRDYPEMSIAEGVKFFSSPAFQAIIGKNCTVYFWTTNHHMEASFTLLKAMGFEQHSTIGTWGKNKLGRGKVLRGRTEHCIIATRGKPTINLTNQDTLWHGKGWEVRHDSQKPDPFFDMVEQLTPAPRYAEIFSRGGRGDKWDCHGDQVGKFAPAVARAAEQQLLKESAPRRKPKGRRGVARKGQGRIVRKREADGHNMTITSTAAQRCALYSYNHNGETIPAAAHEDLGLEVTA